MKIKKIIALLLSVVVILTASPLITFAGLSPYDSMYGKGTYSEPADYRQIHGKVFSFQGATVPEAKFSIVKKAGATIATSADDNSLTRVENIPVGTVIKISNLSSVGSGYAIDMVDFQVTKDNAQVSRIQDRPVVLDSYELTLSSPGTYKFYLCVRDDTDRSYTDHWGNWSYNGSHPSLGLNFGVNGIKQTTGTPEIAGGDDFWGYWYFTEIDIVVVKNPPTAGFKIYYKGNDITDNKTSPKTVDPGDKSLVLEDCSTPFSAAEPIITRKWSYWDVNSGWKEITGGTNKTTVNIADMDVGLPGSGQNKAFKLECTSSTGGFDSAEHTAYFNKVLTSGYIIYYRDQATESDIYPAKERPGLGFGTYIEYAMAAPANSELITPSPHTITLDAATPFTTFTFYYKMDKPPSSKPPSAILKAPDEVMAGQPLRADGSDSWSNNPGGYIADYYFEYEGANLISDNESSVRIWYPNTGAYTIELEVEDEEGSTDRIDHEITVTPPIPTAVLNINGKLKENRKVTIDSSGSTSTTYYPIDNTKTKWEITAISGGTQTDIKYQGALNGNAAKDILFKKAGRYRVRLTVTNTFGRSDSTEITITIAPDLPPIAKLFFPAPTGVEYMLYRDPADSNYATAEVFNESYSPDGDVINKAVTMYCYDSDNDGNYQEEAWYYSADGTTWNPTKMNYNDMLGYFNIFNIGTANITKFTMKSKEVGKYYFVIRVMETIPADETIPEFINESDYRRADTFN